MTTKTVQSIRSPTRNRRKQPEANVSFALSRLVRHKSLISRICQQIKLCAAGRKCGVPARDSALGKGHLDGFSRAGVWDNLTLRKARVNYQP